MKGRGRLVSRRTLSEVEVAYRFDITYRTLEVAGRHAAESKFEVRGSVKAVEGETLSNEHYDLHTAQAIYHVWRDQERWHIEA
ncbi:MAG TPA: hypothetical protein VGD59_04655 [Acidisarcina sp.]